MVYKGKMIPFPAVSRISFFKLIEKLKNQVNKDAFTESLLAECEQHPELLDGIREADFNKDDELIKKLCSTLFPEVLQHNEIKGINPPFEFRPFYLSARFAKILADSGNDDFSFELNDFDEDLLYIFGCASILSFHYHYPFLMTLPIMATIPVKSSSIARTYRIVMNGDLLEISPSETAPAVSHDDYLELISDFYNIELWKKKFPPRSWIFKGIGIINLFDVTQDQSITHITTRLLINPLKNLQEILPDLQLFLGVEDLTIGFLGYEKDAFLRDNSGLNNIILQHDHQLSFKENLCANSYHQLVEERQPIVIANVSQWNESTSCSVVSTIIGQLSFASYILLPIIHNDKVLGYLELASQQAYALNGSSLIKLRVLLPTLATAISRNQNELQNQKEAIIQRQFTTIHPAVKWRFEEEALRFIQQEESDEKPELKDLLFPDIYALYGQFDIRSSSKKRNDAVRADLLQQLEVVSSIMQKILQQYKLPIYEELLFRIGAFQTEINEDVFSGSEQGILHFLTREIHPLFQQIKKENKTLADTINNYFSLLHPELKAVYDLRQNYDQSVTAVNQFLSSLLDKKQIKAQEMFPHYFERYKTDGIEYNIYVGQSITNQKSFSSIELQNLQLWQLLTTCEIELAFTYVQKKLTAPLEIASLILVYSTPLSVHFRMDEKRFDVAGAYNARYEIVKKRIDKACIKGTEERVTCPGKIAIIYANQQDAATYHRYISFMESKGYLLNDATEELEVEDLPGISGLKALRISIDYNYRSAAHP